MQRLADQFVSDVRAVEVAGVDVVHAGGDSVPQHGNGLTMILGRAEHARSRELHGPIAEPVHATSAEGEGSGWSMFNMAISFRDRLHLAFLGLYDNMYDLDRLYGFSNNGR